MNRIILLLLAAMPFGLCAQLSTVIVESGGNSTLYTDLQTAISAAPAGATLYLSGGIHNPDADDVVVNKPLTILGAGFDMDTLVFTGATIIRGDLTLINGADNCVLRGFKVENGLLDIGSGISSTDDITNLFAELCWFENGIDFSDSGNGTNPPSTMLIRHCVMGNASLSYALDVQLQNCFVFGDLTTAYNGIVVDHCLFEDGSSLTVEADNGTFTNNIFLGSSFLSSGEANIFANCIWADTSPGFDAQDQVENMYISSETALFGEDIDFNFHPDTDYSTLLLSVAHGNATDGGIIGHEGGASPWPANFLPPLPYIWNNSNVATQVDENGMLPVWIKVSAQGGE
ncbi:MAG: hypothetical protein KDC12_01315 [Flavobacteriales bacterium]|nr:hypothetical protein [Flavobacteriales bacterium]